jgi:hypothetical protein
MAQKRGRSDGDVEAIESKETQPVKIKREVSNAERERFVKGDEEEHRERERERRKCPYLDTINRQVLDFDMEKVPQ